MPEINNTRCGNCLSAYLRQDLPTGRLLLHFISSSVDQKTYERFFSKQTFCMEDDFVLPSMIANKLNLANAPVIIEKGTYPVLEDDRFLTLSLRVREVNASLMVS
jgi:hypothetical protein